MKSSLIFLDPTRALFGIDYQTGVYEVINPETNEVEDEYEGSVLSIGLIFVTLELYF